MSACSVHSHLSTCSRTDALLLACTHSIMLILVLFGSIKNALDSTAITIALQVVNNAYLIEVILVYCTCLIAFSLPKNSSDDGCRVSVSMNASNIHLHTTRRFLALTSENAAREDTKIWSYIKLLASQ